ncbi:DUF2244 domain-containing protein [Sinimarinibacterium thermocellulolyticum]|uniref:DUF2244 domain-containing protein n=1 Tax=Sinimarinibacterium thermocellulolyticum TaxID=3170016 RepID=A0ABV2ACB9_9GAMM
MDYNPAASNSMVSSMASADAESRLVIGPNASLSVRQACWFMGATSALGLGIAIGMASLGFWPVVPFAGLELAALGAALYVSVRRNAYREVVEIGPRWVRVQFGWLGRGALHTVELQRGPTRVLLEPGGNRHAPTRLLLSGVGRSGRQVVRIGACLTDDERRELAARIRQLLTPGWGPV